MTQFDVEYDVVIVGSGGSGKSAAYTVASESDLSVCVLEKLDNALGTSQYAEGICASESSEQIARGDKVDYPGDEQAPEGAHYPSHQEHFNNYIKQSHHRANPEVVRSFVDNSGETIDILKSIGVEFTLVSIYAVGQSNELYTFHRPDGLGARVQELLLRACENAGVDFFVKTPAKELVIEEGVVKGVLATDADGNEMKVGAKAVIIATGGFGNNLEKVRKYSWMPWIADNNNAWIPCENTGEGLDMALQAGGTTRNIGPLMMGNGTNGTIAGSQLGAAGSHPYLWVNSEGNRFCNEEVSLSFADSANVIGQNFDGRTWSIFDQATVDHLVEDGSEVANGDFIPYGKPLTRLPIELEEHLKGGAGNVFKADTIEELAEKINAPIDQLVATIDRYNGFCANGEDEDFYKSAKYLRPVVKPPFYATWQLPTIIVSQGGVYVNGNFQVCDDYYKPVCTGNLYCVGNDASGLYGDTYNLDCPGSAQGFAHTSGRVAARHAIKALQG